MPSFDELEDVWGGIDSHAVGDALLSKAACWDRELREATSKHGFELIPRPPRLAREWAGAPDQIG